MSDSPGAHDVRETQQLSHMHTDTLSPRTTLQGRYEIIKIIGVGGMGAVYQARDLRFANVFRLCAVKEMFNPTTDPRLQQINAENFAREANILATLNHPGIPKIFDFFSEGRRSYLVLEFIDGQDLEQIINSSPGPLNERQVADWAIQICDVLDYMHNQRPQPIVFRDLKPSNVMINTMNRVMLVDFGIAKVFQVGEKGTMIGTEGYSPPEQYRGISGPIGDIYALGATLHHLLTKSDPRTEPPFTFHERPPRQLNPQVSEAMESVVMKALAYDPKDRFQSAAEMKQALLAVLGRRSRLADSSASDFSTGVLSSEALTEHDVDIVWEFKCEDEVRSSPQLYNGTVYVGAYDYNLYALDVETGELRWKYPTGAGICSTPAIWNGRVYFGSEDQSFYCLHADTGRLVWAHPTRARVRSSPWIALDHVFFGADDGCFYGLNAANGREIWRAQAGGPIRCRASSHEDLIVFSCGDGHIYALDIQNGRTHWRFRTNRQVVSSPLIVDNLVIVGSYDWNIYAIDLASGFNVWRRRTNQAVVASPTLFDAHIYIGSVDGNMYCLDSHNGRVIWKYDTGDQVTSTASVTEEAVYFGCVDHHLYKLDRKTGKMIWRFKTGGAVTSSPLLTQEMVIIGSTDHKVYALPL